MKKRIETLRHMLYQVVYQAHTPAGKGFDIALIMSIMVSVLTIILESVAQINQQYGELLFIDWVFTILFTMEESEGIYKKRLPNAYQRIDKNPYLNFVNVYGRLG